MTMTTSMNQSQIAAINEYFSREPTWQLIVKLYPKPTNWGHWPDLSPHYIVIDLFEEVKSVSPELWEDSVDDEVRKHFYSMASTYCSTIVHKLTETATMFAQAGQFARRLV